MDWLTWPFVVLAGLGMVLATCVAIGVTVAIRVDWVEWCKYRDEKKAAQLLAKQQANCVHLWINQIPNPFCANCGAVTNSYWLQEQERQGRLRRRG